MMKTQKLGSLSKVHQRRRTSMFAVMVCAVALAAAGCGGNDAAAGGSDGSLAAKVAVPARAIGAAPLLGTFALETDLDNGLNLEEVPFTGSSTNVVSAVISGETAFGSVGGATAISAIAEGAPIQIVAGQSGGLYELVLRNDVAEKLTAEVDAPVEDKIAALEGLTIGTSAVGSTNNTVLGGMLREYGLDPEKDVQIAPSDPAALVAGIRDGLYDGGFWSTGVLEPTLADATTTKWISVPAGDIAEYSNFLTGVLIASTQTVQSQPELVEALIASLSATGEAIESDPEGTGDAIQKAFFAELDSEYFDLAWTASLPEILTDPRISEDQLAAHLAVQFDLLQEEKVEDLKYDDVVPAVVRP